MESVYDLIDELDISADSLYKQHTGYRIFNDGLDTSSESSNGSDDSDNENKPPLYTYEEIMANLGDYNPELSASGDSTQETPETIVRKLRQYITEYQCLICNGYGKKHYTQPSHFKGVRTWIEGQLKKVKQPVDWELIFCQVCNLPLTGNEQSRAHYSGYLHEVKASSFCTACLRVIDSHNMVSHCMSKQHMQKEAIRRAEEELDRDYSDAKLDGPTVQKTCSQNNLSGGLTYASVLKKVDPEPNDTSPLTTQGKTLSSGAEHSDRRSSNWRKKIKEFEMARSLSTEPSVVENYMEPRRHKMPNENCDELDTKDVSNALLSYESDRHVSKDEHHKESFHKKKAVTGDDTKIQYSVESSNYYDVLMDSPSNTSPEVDTHSSLNRSVASVEAEPLVEEIITNNEEAIVDGVKNRRKRRRRKASRYSEDISSVADEVSDSAETYCETPRDSRESIKRSAAPMTPRGMHANMFRVLHWLMRWNYCNICTEPVRRQEKGNHYKQKAHIRNFTQFIETEGLYYGYTMTTIGSVYCLPCHMLFETPEQMYIHYESEKHARTFSNFCPICLTHSNCNIHKDFKQKMAAIIDQYIIERIGQGNNSVADSLQNPEEAAKKNDKDNSQDKLPREDGKMHKLVESPINLNSQQKNVVSDNTSTQENITPESTNIEAVTSAPVKNSMTTNKKLTERSQESSEKQLSDKAAEELTKFNSLLQTIPPEDRLSYLIKFNKVLTKTSEKKQHDQPTMAQPKEKLIISDNTKCLKEISNLNSILIQFLESDCSHIQIPSLIMCVRNLKQTVEVMLQTGIDIPIKQVFSFSPTNLPDKVGLSNGLIVLKVTLLHEVGRLRSFMQSQPTSQSEKVTKLFRDFNLTILANFREAREASQFFDNYFYGKDETEGNSSVTKRDSHDNLCFIDSDDDLVFESAIECSCPRSCDKTK